MSDILFLLFIALCVYSCHARDACRDTGRAQCLGRELSGLRRDFRRGLEDRASGDSSSPDVREKRGEQQ